MTIDQAVAILEAERVLQHVGCNGPDCGKGTAWYNYVQHAGIVVLDDPFICRQFNNLELLKD